MNKQKQKRTVYVSVYTNEHSKVLEISDFPSENIFESEKDRRKVKQMDQLEELKHN